MGFLLVIFTIIQNCKVKFDFQWVVLFHQQPERDTSAVLTHFKLFLEGLHQPLGLLGSSVLENSLCMVSCLHLNRTKGCTKHRGPKFYLSFIKTEVKSNFKKFLEAILAVYLSMYFKSFSQTMLNATTSHSTEMFMSMCTQSLPRKRKYAFDIHRKFSLDISQADELQYLRKG